MSQFDEESTRQRDMLFSALFGFVILLGAAYVKGLRPGASAGMIVRALSDGAFVAAVLLIGRGLINWIASTGFFDMFSYGFKSLLVLFTPLKSPKDHEAFFEYKMKKEKNRKKPRTASLIIGLIFFLLSVICFAVYKLMGGA